MTQPQPAGAILTINTAAIVANWRTLAALHAAPTAAPTAAVVKANGYGLGASLIVPPLYDAGCRHFFVAHLCEALAIRALIPDAMLAILNGLLPGAAPDLAAHNILPVLGSLAEIEAWSAEATRLNRPLPALLHIDTGMSRLGLDPAEWTRLLAEPHRLAGIDLRYLMTHLVSAEVPDDPLNAIPLPPFPPAVTLKVRVLQIRDVATGDPVGYDATWRAPRPSRIATACIGYADGWPRILSNTGTAYFDGQPIPLVGRVSMDLTTYDATNAPSLQTGDWLELIGPNSPVDQVATQAQTNGYEILTSLGPRYHRVVVA